MWFPIEQGLSIISSNQLLWIVLTRMNTTSLIEVYSMVYSRRNLLGLQSPHSYDNHKLSQSRASTLCRYRQNIAVRMDNQPYKG